MTLEPVVEKTPYEKACSNTLMIDNKRELEALKELVELQIAEF